MSSANAKDPQIDSLQSLSQAEVGCDFDIRLIEGPGCEQLRRIGFCESLKVRKLSDGRNLVCSVCGSRVALSRKLGEQVLVSPAETAT